MTVNPNFPPFRFWQEHCLPPATRERVAMRWMMRDLDAAFGNLQQTMREFADTIRSTAEAIERFGLVWQQKYEPWNYQSTMK